MPVMGSSPERIRPPVERIDLSGYVGMNEVSKACIGRHVRVRMLRQIEEEDY